MLVDPQILGWASLVHEALPEGPWVIDWFDVAACSDSDPDLFFPGRGQHPTLAKRICSRCPALENCSAYIDRLEVSGEQSEGVWAGQTASERASRRRNEQEPRPEGRGSCSTEGLAAQGV